MNTAVTFGVKINAKGERSFTLITGPNVPHREQRHAYRGLLNELHGEYDEVQLWTSSGGRVKRQHTRAVHVPSAAPVVPVEDAEPNMDDLLGSNPESTESGNPAGSEGKTGDESTPSPVPDKKAAGLAKARAAAAAKKAAVKKK